MAGSSDVDTSAANSLRITTINHPYACSITSSASSPSSSIFSIDAISSQSSAASSSTTSVNVVWGNDSENESSYFPNQRPETENPSVSSYISSNRKPDEKSEVESSEQPFCDAAGPESRQHPRRTHRLTEANAKNGATTSCLRPPPALVRQSERKDNFVDSLVDTTTQMIETIWPLSILSCPRDPTLDGKDQNLIGLRTFVQEVLRRSKTSYSTLQVALYYLVLIRSCVPKHDFTMEQLVDSQSCRAMQCGRRMFLAALILASKYLQDRNFSARAWSKISGLKTLEINTNEMAFLSAVNWKLHIPESVFNRWTDIVLRFSPTSTTASQVSSTLPNSPNIWKSVIPHLTPDLDSFEFGAAAISGDSGYSSSKKNIISRALSTTSTHAQSSPSPQSSEQTRNDTWPMPDVLEPAPHENDYSQNLPSLPRLGLLPTPVLTPQTGNFSTPAAGTFGFCNRRSSMSVAMAQVQSNCLARSTLDNPNHWKRRLPEPFPTSARRSSLAQSVSSLSSPESMISDVSSRSSRSSSISSVASSTCALPQPPLAVQVTRRCAKMQISGLKGCSRTILRTSPSEDLPCEGISTSPDALPSSEGDYFTRPNRPLAKIKSKDPADRAHCNNASAHEAAAALRDLALSRHWMPPYPSKPTSSRKRENPSSSELSMAAHDSDDAHRPMTQCSIAKPRKRERLCSSEMSVQSCVRELMAPCYLGKTVRCRTSNEDDSTVLPDRTIATSFLVSKNSMSSFGSKTMPMFTKDDLTRERSCAAGASMEDSQKISRLIKERAAMPAPGMWEGII